MFEKLTETALLISQMKSPEEILFTLDKMRTFALTELELIIMSYQDLKNSK